MVSVELKVLDDLVEKDVLDGLKAQNMLDGLATTRKSWNRNQFLETKIISCNSN